MKSYEEYYAELMHSIFHGNKKKSNSIWAAVFFILFIVNGISFLWALITFAGAGMGSLLLIPLGLLFAIVDFIPVLLFIIIQKPKGIAKAISYTVLAFIFLTLAFFVFGIIVMMNPDLIVN